MKYCQYCGARVSDDSLYCESCGAKIREESAKPTPNYVGPTNSGISERNIVLAIILTIITCGIYGLYWQVKLNNELLQLSRKDGPGGVAVIFLTIITCGIYGYYWYYKMGTCIDAMSGKEDKTTGILFIILGIFGFGIVNYIIAQNAINENVSK